MPTATSSSRTSRARAVLFGYNLPFALWTAAAVCKAIGLGVGDWPCPVLAILAWCPTCGMTRAYAALLRGEGAHGIWFLAILAFFLVNLAASLLKARRIAGPIVAAPAEQLGSAPPAPVSE